MSELEHARSMLVMAQKDLKALKGMGDSQVFADEVFGFHAQQAVEKALKAWIAALGEEYPLTHNIARLLAIVEGQGGDVERFWDFVEYTAFAVEFRYESMSIAREPLDRPTVIGNVQRLFDYIKSVIQ